MRVLGLQPRVALEDVERVLAEAERVELLHERAVDALRVARLQLLLRREVVRDDRAREGALVVVVVARARRAQVELRLGLLEAQPALQVDLAHVLREHRVGGVHALVVREGIAAAEVRGQ